MGMQTCGRIKNLVTLVIPLLLWSCASRVLTEDLILSCLARTDFNGHDDDLRSAIGWHIGYAQKVKETTCCALQPRSDVLTKRTDLPGFKAELIKRIDLLETQAAKQMPAVSPAEVGHDLRRNDTCYGALMDLYHDTVYALRSPAR